MGLVPTGKEYKALLVLIHRIVGGKIAEEWSQGSGLAELMQQRLEQERIERERIEQELLCAAHPDSQRAGKRQACLGGTISVCSRLTCRKIVGGRTKLDVGGRK
jgi:hypothetical protein